MTVEPASRLTDTEMPYTTTDKKAHNFHEAKKEAVCVGMFYAEVRLRPPIIISERRVEVARFTV
jgi:hypothetical protein